MGGVCDDLLCLVKDKDEKQVLVDSGLLEHYPKEDRLDDGMGGLIFAKRLVFFVGELLAINAYGREICGRGRKPSNWHIGYEIFFDPLEALRRAKEVTRLANEGKPIRHHRLAGRERQAGRQRRDLLRRPWFADVGRIR